MWFTTEPLAVKLCVLQVFSEGMEKEILPAALHTDFKSSLVIYLENISLDHPPSHGCPRTYRHRVCTQCWGGLRSIWSRFKVASGDSLWIIALYWNVCRRICLCVVTALQTALKSRQEEFAHPLFHASFSLNATHQGHNRTRVCLRGQSHNHASWLRLIRLSDGTASSATHHCTLQQSRCLSCLMYCDKWP